jgi:hypothetical protein
MERENNITSKVMDLMGCLQKKVDMKLTINLMVVNLSLAVDPDMEVWWAVPCLVKSEGMDAA